MTADEVMLFSDDPAAVESAKGLTESVARSGTGTGSLAEDVLIALGERPSLRCVAIVGGDAMSGHQARQLLRAEISSGLDLCWEDNLVEELRLRKSPAEITLLRRAAEIAEEALEAGFSLIAPGIREAEIVAAMAEVVARNEAVLANAFVYTTQRDGQVEDNRLPTHSGRRLETGDLFTIDLSGVYAGYFFDLARSAVVEANPTFEQQQAYSLAKGAVDTVVNLMQPGTALGAAASAGSAFLRNAGIDPDVAEFPARGHGLGLGFEGPWVRDDSALVLEPGMVISIEQFVTVAGVSATFERNILIGAAGPEDLNAVRDFWVASHEQEAK